MCAPCRSVDDIHDSATVHAVPTALGPGGSGANDREQQVHGASAEEAKGGLATRKIPGAGAPLLKRSAALRLGRRQGVIRALKKGFVKVPQCCHHAKWPR